MSKQRGRKRTISHEEVVAYAQSHPDMYQDAIAEHFGLTQSRISQILRNAGISSIEHSRRGRPLIQKLGQTDEEFYWETVLHDAGLSMERGLRLNNRCLVYGYDPTLAKPGDRSITAT